MNGIVAFGSYLPYYRIERKAIAEALGASGAPGTRSVACHDEDALGASDRAASPHGLPVTASLAAARPRRRRHLLTAAHGPRRMTAADVSLRHPRRAVPVTRCSGVHAHTFRLIGPMSRPHARTPVHTPDRPIRPSLSAFMNFPG